MLGKTLKGLDFRNKYNCQIIAILEKGLDDKIFIPDAETIIREHFLLFILGKDADLAKLTK